MTLEFALIARFKVPSGLVMRRNYADDKVLSRVQAAHYCFMRMAEDEDADQKMHAIT